MFVPDSVSIQQVYLPSIITLGTASSSLFYVETEVQGDKHLSFALRFGSLTRLLISGLGLLYSAMWHYGML